jgi:beta-N-acetylglucosaminidase/murein DD-endopeptidase MepM/ murein hydrolase activator NlpD
MKILQTSDYRIYVDDVRVDPYVKNWSANCGLTASDAIASITLYRTKDLENWKGYLAQVRIFGRNVFSGKFGILFEGEIVNRSYGDQRTDVGEIIFNCKGFYHWLDIPIPLLISTQDTFNAQQVFEYEAQNINVTAIQGLWKTQADTSLSGLNLQQVIDKLFQIINNGYYLYPDSSFTWADIQKRFKVMGDIIPAFRQAGFLDITANVTSTQISSFYVYLNDILTQLMFEFYQDRDGALRIKNPSWADSILKAHILDESIVENAQGFNDWENEPTRVLAIGGPSDLSTLAQRNGASGINAFKVPMGLYIGLPGSGQYLSQDIEVQIATTGNANDYTGGVGNGNGFFDDISMNYKINSPFGNRSGGFHYGTDYGLPQGTLVHNLGYDGTVLIAQPNNPTAGNWVAVKESFGGKTYAFFYMHLSSIDSAVKVGGTVKSGQKLGASGSTGDSSGPHLHLGIYEIPNNSTSVDPRKDKGATALDPDKFLKQLRSQADTGTTPNAPGNDTITQIMNADLGAPSNQPDAATLNKLINKNAKSSSLMYNKGDVFLNASKASGLNVMYLISHAAWESGWGTSNIVRSKYDFYGIGAFNSSPAASAYSYSGADAGIVNGAVWIRKNYYDRGQKTIWTMDHNPSGSHNYAVLNNGQPTPEWSPGIAKIWAGMGYTPGKGTAAPAPDSSASGSSGSGPLASTGGFSFTTSFLPATNNLSPFQTIQAIQTFKPKPVDYMAFSNSQEVYPIPTAANTYKSYIEQRPNGVNINMICCIIEVASGWKEKYNNNGHYGLMGIPDAYLKEKSLLISQMYDPQTNIMHGTLQFSAGYQRFSNKVTFALAGLYLGDLTKVEAAINAVKTEDFSKARTQLPSDCVSFVDEVIQKFCTLFGGNYINGDPNVPISNGPAEGNVTADNSKVKDYQSAYKPLMSDEERQYKVNLKVTEELLIRYDMTNASGTGSMNADDLIERYAKYMMQLFRAESHGVNITLSTCLPFLRPGFNAWMEPTRRNAVFYITRVSHQGSFSNGSFTTVTGAFVRDPKTYDNIEDNIFVGTSNSKALDYGEVIAKSDMDGIIKELQSLHNDTDEVIGDARAIPTLSKMYSSAVGKTTDYTTIWSDEYSSADLDAKIATLYKSAPNMVQTRKSAFATIIKNAADFYTKTLLNTPF